MSGMRETERAVASYADHNAFWHYGGDDTSSDRKGLADDLLRQSGIMNDPHKMRDMMDDLVKTGVLPEMAWRDSDNLDANDDGKVTRSELDSIVENREKYSPTTVLAAEYVRENMDHISQHGNMDGTDNDYVTENELEHNKIDAMDHRSADPDQMFGTKDDPVSVANDSNPERDKGTKDADNGDGGVCRDGDSDKSQGSKDDTGRGVRRRSADDDNDEDSPRARQSRRDDDDSDSSRGNHSRRNDDESDEDGRGHHGRSESRRDRDSDDDSCDEDGDHKSRNRRDSQDDDSYDGPRHVKAQDGDGVWQIAERSCGEGASKDEVSKEWVRIMKANHFSNKHRLMVGEEVIIPGAEGAEDVQD